MTASVQARTDPIGAELPVLTQPRVTSGHEATAIRQGADDVFDPTRTSVHVARP